MEQKIKRGMAILLAAVSLVTSLPVGLLKAEASEKEEVLTTTDYLSEHLKASKAEKAEAKAEEYWEEEAPKDTKEAAELYVKDAQGKEAEGTGADGQSVALEDVDITTSEKRFDRNGLKETAHTVRVTYTIANREYLKVNTIDDLFAKNEDAFLTSLVSTSPVYESKEYEDCYVAFLNYGAMNGLDSGIIDADFVTNTQANPKDVTGDVEFDKKAGIVYIPKSYYFATDGTELGYDLQAQILVAPGLGKGVEIHVTAENHSRAKTMFRDEKQVFTAFNNLTVNLVTPETADKVDFHDIDVYVNDGALPLRLTEGKEAFYDRETGEYTLNCLATTVYALRFEIKGGILADLLGATTGSQKTYAAMSGANMTFVTNQSTGKMITPSIEYDKIKEGNVYNYDGSNSTHGGMLKDMLKKGQKNFIYAPYLGDTGTDAVRDAFYDKITSEGGKDRPKLSALDKLVIADGQNKTAGKSDNKNKEKFFWYMFGIGAPSGVLTEIHDKTTASFGSLSEWNWSDTYTYDGKVVYRHMYVGMCCHVEKDILSGPKKNQVSVLEKGKGYVVLGLAQSDKGSSANGQAGATVIKVAASNRQTVTKSAQKSGSQEVSFQLTKTDVGTGVGLAGAEFTFSCDGARIGTAVSDGDGKVSYKYTRNIKTANYISTKTYVTNWSDLPEAVRKQETANGYYSDPTTAATAAQNEVNQKAEAEYNSLFYKNHTWTVAETKPPFGHSRAPQDVRTVVETINEKKFSMDYANPAEYRDVKLVKKSSHEDLGAEATLKGAVYGLYAKENILFTDNRTVVYRPDELVAELRTDEKGKAGIEGLHPGVYYLKELEAPVGFEKDPNTYTLNMNEQDAEVDLTDQLIRGRIRIQKTYGQGDPEEGAEFEVYNIKDERVAVLTTDEEGIAVSDHLPYGTYTVRQTKGIAGYMVLPDQIVELHDQQVIHRIKGNDAELYAGIAITKTTVTEDWETGYVEKKPEAGAEFEISKNGKVVETLVCDASGVAISGKLEPGCTYRVTQTKGDENFAFTKPFDVTFEENEYVIKRYNREDGFSGKKVKLEKEKKNEEGTEPEENAEFYVLDAEAAGDIKEADLSTAEKRLSYVSGLPDEAIITTMLTDKHGADKKLLVNLPEGHDFVVLQVRGAAGYTLAEPYFSADHKPGHEGLINVYSVKAEDVLEDWGKIQIAKTMVTDRKGGEVQTRPEKGAEFEIYTSGGKVIDTIVTDSNGKGTSKQLPFGVYMVHQSKGAASHQKTDDFRVVVNKDNKQETVTYPLQNEEKRVEFLLTKKSAETGKVLGGATYEIYNEGGNRVASITTDKDGKASCQLPFGKYTAKEVKAPDGYKLGKEFAFVLSYRTLEYENGTATYEVEEQDDPVYAEIKLTKVGDAFTGKDQTTDSEIRLLYEKGPVPGAEYTLYAREDITKDDGTPLYRAGEKIDEETTDRKGTLQFKWKGMEGVDPTLFPMGSYYIKETKSPYGYTLDPTEYEVVLTWDQKPSEMNKDVESDDTDGFAGTLQKAEPNSGKYVLKSLYPDAVYPWLNVTGDITFTDEKAPAGAALTDVSSLGDGSVVMWESGEDAYISTQTEAQDVIFNRNSEGLFRNARAENIYFDCVDTVQTEVMTGMFEGCYDVNVLDLRNFSTRQVRFVDRMFNGCDDLTTVYTVSAELEGVTPDTIRMEEIIARPRYEFLTGVTYSVDDFEFYGKYSDGMKQRICVSADEVTISPEKAEKTGKAEVKFTFKDNSSYHELGETKAEVQVIETPELPDKPSEDYAWKTSLTDELQKHTIRFSKTDKDKKPLVGAKFALVANCNIVDKAGNTVFYKGNEFMYATSAMVGAEAVVEFRDLPSDLYKKDPSEPGSMFKVIEKDAPDGYTTSDVAMEFSGSLADAGNNAVIIHTSPEEDGSREPYYTVGTTTFYDAEDVVNKKSLPSQYVEIIKEWDDAWNIVNRPASVTVYLNVKENGKTEQKRYRVTGSRNDKEYKFETDIKKEDWKKGTVQILSVTESVPSGYQLYSTNSDRYKGEVRLTNRLTNRTIHLMVGKKWDDDGNRDGIRPDSVKADLYVNGKYNRTVTLRAENGYSLDLGTYPIIDGSGNPYRYEIREQESDILTGDEATGYKVKYATSIAPNSTPIQMMYITNTHVPQKTEFRVEKEWEDEKDQDGLRPKSITATLEGTVGESTTVAREQVTLSAANGWKGKVTGLPVYYGGEKIRYTWTEDPWQNLTGNEETGYKAIYQNQTADASKPCVIKNLHIPKRGVIRIQKAIKAKDVTRDLQFTFELTGTLKSKAAYQDAKTVTFTKAEVTKLTRGQTLTKEVVFEDLDPGDYRVTEGGMEAHYRLTDISSNTGKVLDKNGAVLKDNYTGTTGTGKEPYAFECTVGDRYRTWDVNAVFTNAAREGSVTIHKKDGKGKALKDVVYVLHDETGAAIRNGTTDGNGTLVFDGLPIGEYTLRETKTVPGNSLLTKQLEIRIPMHLSEKEVKEQQADTAQAVHTEDGYYFYDLTYDITNDAVLDLPKTGGKGRYLGLAAGLASLFAGIWLCAGKERRRRRAGRL